MNFYTQHGKAGQKYIDGEYKGVKDLAKKTRQFVKQEFKGYKVSVRIQTYSGGQSLYVTLLQAPFDIYKDEKIKRTQINHYHFRQSEEMTDGAKNFFSKVDGFLNQYHMDDSDGQI